MAACERTREKQKRPKARLAFGFETLEQRDTPATAQEQLMIELINRARANPAAEAARFGIDLNEGVPAGQTISPTPKQPLAPNDALLNAIRGHLQFLISSQTFSHTGSGGSSIGSRISGAGYNFTTAGENLAFRSTTATPNVTEFVAQQHEDLFVDTGIAGRGHRTNMLRESFKEIGSGVVTGPFQGFNAVMTGQDFGARSGNSFVTGVAFTDAITADNFYTVGEGVASVTIQATNTATSQVFTTTTDGAGGYSLQVPNGTYTVRTTGASPVAPITVTNIVVNSQNVKVDFTPNKVSVDPTFFGPFADSNDILGAGPVSASSSAQSLIFVNKSPIAGEPFAQAFNPITNLPTGNPLTGLDVSGFGDATDVTLVGDVENDGVADIIQFNRPASEGGAIAGTVIRVVNAANGALKQSFSAGATTGGQSYADLLNGLVDPDDRVFVGHFTRTDHLEALFFNRTNTSANQTALRTIDLVTGQVTFTSLHDGNIFSGWVDPQDEYVISDVNGDNFDDLVIFNRVANPEAFRATNIGFVGMISIRDVGGPAGPFRGFFRFFDWNFAAPGENSVFPGYDELADKATVGHVINNGQRQAVILLVNSSSNVQAAYAVLQPRPITQGQRDSFQLLSTIFHGGANSGFFDSDDTIVLGDFNGDNSDEVASFSRSAGSGAVRAFNTFTGATLSGSGSSRPTTLAPSTTSSANETTASVPPASAPLTEKPMTNVIDSADDSLAPLNATRRRSATSLSADAIDFLFSA